VVPAGDPFAAIVNTADSLDASTVVAGLSTRMTAEDQAFHTGRAWEALQEPRRQFTFNVVMRDGSVKFFHIGPHAPALQSHDVQLVHQLWLKFRGDASLKELHHSDIVTYALERLAMEFEQDQHDVLMDLQRFIEKSNPQIQDQLALENTNNVPALPSGSAMDSNRNADKEATKSSETESSDKSS
ncbi:MAG: hypothetical protein ABI076_00695, partial [Acidobacteriaceae bacterium]